MPVPCLFRRRNPLVLVQFLVFFFVAVILALLSASVRSAIVLVLFFVVFLPASVTKPELPAVVFIVHIIVSLLLSPPLLSHANSPLRRSFPCGHCCPRGWVPLACDPHVGPSTPPRHSHTVVPSTVRLESTNSLSLGERFIQVTLLGWT